MKHKNTWNTVHKSFSRASTASWCDWYYVDELPLFIESNVGGWGNQETNAHGLYLDVPSKPQTCRIGTPRRWQFIGAICPSLDQSTDESRAKSETVVGSSWRGGDQEPDLGSFISHPAPVPVLCFLGIISWAALLLSLIILPLPDSADSRWMELIKCEPR